MAQNLVEKIVQNFAVGLADGQLVYCGDYVSVRPRHPKADEAAQQAFKKTLPRS